MRGAAQPPRKTPDASARSRTDNITKRRCWFGNSRGCSGSGGTGFDAARRKGREQPYEGGQEVNSSVCVARKWEKSTLKTTPKFE